MNPLELYAEVAALYEVCYKAAQRQLQRRREAEAQPEGTAPTTAPSSAPNRGLATSRIRFPWRIAEQQLQEMKVKARQLAESERLWLR